MKTITLQQLKKAHACSEQVNLFEAKFGQEVEITEEVCASVASEFDFDWAAISLLSDSAYDEYRKLRDSVYSSDSEYLKADASAWVEYQKASASALAEYQKIRAVAFAKVYLKSES